MSIEVSPVEDGVYRIFSTYCKESITVTTEDAYELLALLYDLRNSLFARANGLHPQVDASGEPWLSDCPDFRGMHTAGTGEMCPLNPERRR